MILWKNKLKSVIKILEESNVSEIEIHFWGQKIRVSKNASNQIKKDDNLIEVPQLGDVGTLSSEAPKESAVVQEKLPAGLKINSPMVGTFYRASSPESPPFVKIGDRVEVGQTLCIIEAMKIMNEIESEHAGTVSDILVENGKPVEFGQPLFIITPKS